ncbi:MAG: helix-turn-helix transcriptional regulator [Thermoanaerobacter sp.]|jgi:putative transcriptional regulator|uniref:helix-turn-helix transcriptional regulator n=1 Tax=unclassified Thermoanaerobacter TaxID=2636821 RepID=UPI0000E1DF9D|nr:helix-turn-helix transcriptional regulator [Thermoanaerobacter sp. X514]ABY92010.1 transcriptional regulator, XRE family [Thermoanaerobacter sp. X514]
MVERKKLKELRIKNNLLQKDVAEVIGITPSYYGMIEQGVRTPTLPVAKKIAEFFNSTIEELFFEDVNNIMLSDKRVINKKLIRK